MIRRFPLTGLILAACFLVEVGSAVAQQRYELIAPASGLTSRAERTDQRLRVEDAAGNVTVYSRDPRHDTADGMWLAYVSSAARQVIRWPANDRGPLQVASDARPLVFRESQMEVRPLHPVAPAVRPGQDLPGRIDPAQIDPEASYRLVPVGPALNGRALSSDATGDLILQPLEDEESQLWHLATLAPGVVRVHSDARGRRWSLAGRADEGPRLARTSESLDQLWQIVAHPGEPGQFWLASLGGGAAPRVLTWDPAGRLLVRPRGPGAGQLWRLVKVRALLPPVFDDYRFVSREIRPNPPLPPAQLQLVNSHSKELWVLLVDAARGDAGQRIILPPGKGARLSLERDVGGTVVEVYERGLPNGLVQRDEWATPIPPTVRYDVSVYELIVQSVAIDRTVPGGKLEDVQHAPRSLGWFELPPGSLLSDGPLDVYETAKSRNNPGGVRHIDPAQWRPRPGKTDPVEALYNQFPPQPGK